MKSNELMNIIKDNISSGKWKRGEKIPSEIELAKYYSVGRNTIRSIIQKYVTMGVLMIKPGDGTYVSNQNIYDIILNAFIPMLDLNYDEYVDLYELRREVETEAVAYASVNRNEIDLADLFESLVQMRAQINNRALFISASYNFHIILAKATKNKLYKEMIIKLRDIIMNIETENNKFDESIIKSRIAMYENLFYYLIKKDSASCQKYMRDILSLFC